MISDRVLASNAQTRKGGWKWRSCISSLLQAGGLTASLYLA